MTNYQPHGSQRNKTRLIVAHSCVADGSMLNREDGRDGRVFEDRVRWLSSIGMNPAKTYRLSLSYEDNNDFCRYREINTGDTPVALFDAANEEADALVTTQLGQALFLPLADCVGAVLFDEEHGVLMLSHLGRHSVEQNGGVRSVEHLVEHYGTKPQQIKVWLSAAVGKDTYKIFALKNKGLKEVVFEQLHEAGVLFENITDTPFDTAVDLNYYSHSEFLKGNRLDSGRHAIVAMMTVEATVKMV